MNENKSSIVFMKTTKISQKLQEQTKIYLFPSNFTITFKSYYLSANCMLQYLFSMIFSTEQNKRTEL